jgi:hypothetical protein
MAVTIQCVEYFNTNVRDQPGAAYDILSKVAGARVNLLAFSAIPTGLDSTQLVLFPDHSKDLAKVAEGMRCHRRPRRLWLHRLRASGRVRPRFEDFGRLAQLFARAPGALMVGRRGFLR